MFKIKLVFEDFAIFLYTKECMTSVVMYFNFLLVLALFSTFFTVVNCYDETSSNNIYPKNV